MGFSRPDFRFIEEPYGHYEERILNPDEDASSLDESRAEREADHDDSCSRCRCYGCGSHDPMACGRLCADCSWEDHLAGMAHTGASWYDGKVDARTPECCLASRATARGHV